MRERPEEEIDRVAAAIAWWRGIQDQRGDGSPNPRADRASRARLRRAAIEDAVTEEAVLDLYRLLSGPQAGFDPQRLRLAARLALVLAHVREEETELDNDRPKRFARRIGRAAFDDPIEEARLKPIRFRRLLAARDEEDIVREFRRAVHLAGRTANIGDLARLLLTWERDGTRTRFAFDYFAAGRDPSKREAQAAAGI